MSRCVHARFESDDFSCEGLAVVSLRGRERIGGPFDLKLLLRAAGGSVDAGALLGACARLVIVEAQSRVERRLPGMIAKVRERYDYTEKRRVLSVGLVPRLSRAALIRTQEVFLDASVPDILKAKLARVGLEADDIELRLAAPYPARAHVVQYKETDLAFVSRLCEHLGVSYFFVDRDGQDVLVLTDHNRFELLDAERRIIRCSSTDAADSVYDLVCERGLMPRLFAVSDALGEPSGAVVSASVEADHGLAGGVVEYGSNVTTVEQAEALARIRAGEHASRRLSISGRSDRVDFGAGRLLSIQGHPVFGDVALLLESVEHALEPASAGGSTTGTHQYESTFVAVPTEGIYRPPRVTPIPRIHGIVTGVLERMAARSPAPEGTVGQHSVRLLFDTSDERGDRACVTVRAALGDADKDLQPGAEVLLAFADGDVDRPVIVGVAAKN